MFAVRWLTAIGAELARQAIHEIRTLTQDARTRARVLEKTPHRVPIPGFHWAARMTTAEVTLALGARKFPDGCRGIMTTKAFTSARLKWKPFFNR